MQKETLESLKKKNNRVGMTVFLILVVLTIIEFAIALASSSLTVLLVGVAVAKAYLIIVYFMHIGRLFAGSEE